MAAFRISCARDGVTTVDARSDRIFARHCHDEFGIGVLTDGAQRSWSGRGPVEASRGDVITVNPGEVHDGAPVGPARSWSMLYLAPAVVAPLVADITEGRAGMAELQAPVIADARVARLFAATRAAALAVDRDAEALDSHLLVLLGALLRAPPAPAGAAPRLARVRERIDDDPAAPHALADLAALAGLSRFATVRRFARLTGLPPHAYVVQRRLDAARRLLRGGARPAEAAAAAGFADQSHFHRAFVARYGLTPGAFGTALAR